MKSHTSLFIKLGLACHYKKNENVEDREAYARSGLDS